MGHLLLAIALVALSCAVAFCAASDILIENDDIVIPSTSTTSSASDPVETEAVFSESFERLWPSRAARSEVFEQGHRALQEWEAKSRSQPCFRAALKSMKVHCRELLEDADLKTKFAVQVTNCEFAKSGLPEAPCTPDMTAIQCTKALSYLREGFSVYVQMLNHVDNICFYVQSDLFQERTSEAVRMLMLSADSALSRFRELSSMVSSADTKLGASLAAQQQLTELQTKLEIEMTRAAAEERRFKEILQGDMAQLKDFSFQLDVDMKRTHAQHEKLLTSQTELGSMQETMRKETHHHWDSVQTAVGVVQQRFAELRELHEKISDELKNLDEAHGALHVKMGASINKQDDLLIKQHELEKEMTVGLTHLKEAHEHVQRQTEELKASTNVLSTQLTNITAQGERFLHDHGRIIRILVSAHEKLENIYEQVFSITTVTFYAAASLMLFLVTATERTKGSRLFLFAVMAACFAIERSMVREVAHAVDVHAELQSQFTERVYLLRLALIAVSLVSIMMSMVTYRDLAKENNDLLRRIAAVHHALGGKEY
jgi:hypothetical protein